MSKKTVFSVIIKGAAASVVWLTIGTKAFASTVLPLFVVNKAELPTVWPKVRDEFEEPEVSQALNSELVDFVQRAAQTSQFEAEVRLSYAMVAIADVRALDKLWIDTLIKMADSDAITAYLDIRSKIDVVAVQDREYYLEHWVWTTGKQKGSQGS